MPHIINDENFELTAAPPGFAKLSDAHSAGPGHNRFGLKPRDYAKHPMCSYRRSTTLDMPVIPRNEWADRIREGHANKTFLSYHRRKGGPNGGHIPSLDQNGQGYCWAYSTTICVMLMRAAANLKYVRLSAHMIGCLVKNYRDQGGWGAHSLEFATENGISPVEFWPEKSMSRSNDTQEMRAAAKLYRPAESWVDLAPPVYNRNLSEDQAMTCLLTNCAVIGDFYWWGHSVGLMDPIITSRARRRPSILKTDFGSLDLNDPKDLEIYGAAFGKKGINSWTDNYGDKGEFDLEGSRAQLAGGAAIRAVTLA